MRLEELCHDHPVRVLALFSALDLQRPELDTAQQAYDAGDLVGACRALLDYYARRIAAPEDPEKEAWYRPYHADAESILEGDFTFYGLTARVPQHPDGGLDWTYTGPNQDLEWAWGLNRHSHLNALLEAYLESKDTRYLATLDRHLKDWVLSSPYPGVKSSTPQWRGLEAALRMSPWSRIFMMLQHDPGFSPAARILMLSSLPDHAHYLRHFHARTGNWLTMEMNGLLTIALTWPEFRDAELWIAYAMNQLVPEMERQVYPDGVQMELTSHYHRVAGHNFQDFADRIAATGRSMPDVYMKQLEAMWHYLAYSMRPNGYGVLNNDSDYDHTAPIVLNKAAHYSRPDWQYIATSGVQGVRPESRASVFFPWAGQAILRNGWGPDAHWTFFDVGPFGIGHQHHDKLHVSIAAYGRDILVDSGRYTYVGGPWRRYFTGSASHNVILVDGGGQKAYTTQANAPLVNQLHFTDAYDCVRGIFDNGYEKLMGEAVHHRILCYIRDRCWIVLDRIVTDRPRRLTALWRYHPDCSVVIDAGTVLSTDPDVGNIRIVPFGPVDWNVTVVRGQESPELQGWYSAIYNTRTPNSVAVFNGNIQDETVFGWLMVPAIGLVPNAVVVLNRLGPDMAEIMIDVEDQNKMVLRIPLMDGCEVALD